MPKDEKTQSTSKVQNSLRPYNERLLINLIRTDGEMSKADLTRASGLSAQTATVIVNRLVEEGLLKAGKAVKGKVGQPSTPYSLNPEGALSIGIKVGRRSLEVASMSFDYKIVKRLVKRYDFPHLETIKRDVLSNIDALFGEMSQQQRDKVVGIGIAIPDDLSAWEATVGAPAGEMADWADADLANDVSEAFGLPVKSLNDASAACLAEIALGNSARHACFAYFYIGTFIGGGVAIGGQLFNGQHNLAGAIASLPIAATSSGVAPQLLEGASLHYLEQAANAAGLNEERFYHDDDIDAPFTAIFHEWLETAAPQIAFAAMSVQAFLDPDAIIIDSSLHPKLTFKLIDKVRTAISSHYDHRGLAQLNVSAGENGLSARAIGSGIVPFLSEFSLESSF